MSTPKDITACSSSMQRDSAILYPNKNPQGDDPSDFRGVTKDADGRAWWIGIWTRICKGQNVYEFRRVPKKD